MGTIKECFQMTKQSRIYRRYSVQKLSSKANTSFKGHCSKSYIKIVKDEEESQKYLMTY